ncbi:glycosyltransferase family 25 protein [Paracoccus sp. M683]|uniref:glycosyltransferase family 25 protein n=1 Tax=Paracoccus sp. M683 TaxID=2594268 RepID=UPI0011807A26|nr:glycosyltransferase family 25 protein [Paracoccus sp. M683]TRW95937.1 glycosyltransferase family 25 protein [Paracoccus sp. M683]
MKSEAQAFLSVFDRIYVINLAHRDDRRREMQAELGRIGLGLDHPSVTVFQASFPPDPGAFPTRGARGCFESHLRLHQQIQQDGVSRALILEDDADFAPGFADRLAAITDDLHRLDWDQFLSVSPQVPQPGDEEIGAELLRLSPQHHFPLAHFMGVSARFSELAIPFLQAMQARSAGDPAGGPMHVDGAYGWLRAAHPELMVLTTRAPLAVQRSSRSDIADLPVWDRVPGVRQLAGSFRRFPPLVALMRRIRGH